MFMKPDKFKKKKIITWICWTLWASEAKYLLLLFTEPAVSVTFHYKAHPVIYLFIYFYASTPATAMQEALNFKVIWLSALFL